MKNNMKLIQKFLMIVMVMLAWSSITISAKGDKVDDNHLSCDGPYVIYQPDGGVRVVSVTVAGEVKDTTYASLPDNFTFHVTDHEGNYPFDVRLHPVVRQEWKQSQAKKTFVMSDPHGRLNLVISLLQANGVIDSQLKWSYGDNQLVVIGDIFDRGYDVPQIFWLFYKLEAEAAECGGRVSVMLGNHEPMELAGDMRYAKPKYKLLAEKLGMSYRHLFFPNTELGKWLGTRNAMQVIGRNLFVHAGISRDFYERNLSIPVVNDTISSVLFKKSKQRKAQSEFCKFLYGNRGPIWYRGLVLKTKKWSPLPSDSLDMVLQRYDVDRIYVGHTIFKDIKKFYKGKVIAVNVDNLENYNHHRGRAVLIEDDKVYVVGDKGIKRQIVK